MWVSKPPAVRILPSPAMISVPGPMTMVDVGLNVGIPRLADRGDISVLQPDVGFYHSPMVRMSALVITVSAAPCRLVDLALPHAVADHLAAAEFYFLATGRQIFFHLDDRDRCRRGGGGHLCSAQHIRIDASGLFELAWYSRNEIIPNVIPKTLFPR